MKAFYEWDRVRLGDHVKIMSGVAPSMLVLSQAGRLPYIKVEDLNRDAKYVGGAREYTDRSPQIVPACSVVFPKRGAAILNNKVRLTRVPIVMDTNLMAVVPSPHFDAEFLYYFLLDQGLPRLADTSSIPQINNKHISPLSVLRPTLPEQRKIAAILGAWDDAIEKTGRMRLSARNRYVSTASTLFEGERTKHWNRVALSDQSTRIRRRSDGEPHPITTISAKSGFVAQADKYERDMAGASAATYTLLRAGEFAYNKGNSLTYPQGCIFALQHESALVPSVYLAFALSPSLNRKFYEHYFAHGALNRQLAQRISSGVRNNGLLNINADSFFSVLIPVPERSEQDRIARLLNTLVAEIALIEREIELLKEQKRGLMQKLLTGEIRVAVDSNEELSL